MVRFLQFSSRDIGEGNARRPRARRELPPFCRRDRCPAAAGIAIVRLPGVKTRPEGEGEDDVDSSKKRTISAVRKEKSLPGSLRSALRSQLALLPAAESINSSNFRSAPAFAAVARIIT